MPTIDSAPVLQRIRHPFRARHVQLLARESISPGFLRLTLGGAELDGFISAGFDDHIKLILPQAGLEKPRLPVMIDGRPHIEGERPTMRDYTPLRHDAARNTLAMDFALHGTGPAAEWARGAPIGQWVGLAGPRGSMLVPVDLQWHWLLGDETAMPAIERRLAELPPGTQAVVRVQLADGADRRAWRSAANLDLQWVESLAPSVQSLDIPQGSGFIWAAGEHRAMAQLRKQVLSKPGADPRHMRIASYWKQGEVGHHEELGSAD
ncbi:siderophore-interacting protein [Pollutimonas sp. M17]|uniref:siderophore-interacting protein n=1 Tax=Pollutimonas sp. M17 TaxID=2962065 RepID=UPI0021F46D26|nr:siderophore-interacting protein [Pollutimonas sp. M17]UYO94880.1 siderophore-interacting protein [Pollutimonas sp. M17]